MKTKKAFDCVKMKGEIQSRLAAQWAGKSPESVQAEIREFLATSDVDIARWWRRVSKEKNANKK